jgi:hypothetical protein
MDQGLSIPFFFYPGVGGCRYPLPVGETPTAKEVFLFFSVTFLRKKVTQKAARTFESPD